MTTLCLMPGDGIGIEVIAAAREVLTALDPALEFVEAEIGLATYEQCGTPLPEETLATIRAADATLFGAVTTPIGVPDYSSPVLGMRQSLDLYANIRPCRTLPHPTSKEGVNFVIVRENTEGLYARRERLEDNGDTAIAERVITRKASARIVRFAVELASTRSSQFGRPGRVTLVHKANILRLSDGLFREAGLNVAKEYPAVETCELLVDACAMNLIRNPSDFDVIVTTNLFGDILSDEASMLVGGLGLAHSANLGDRAAIFEPVHGSAPDIAGKGVANPMATFLSAVSLLEYLDRKDQAGRLRGAVEKCLRQNQTTADLGGTLDTHGVTRAIIAALS